MNNIETIQFLYSNYKKFFKFKEKKEVIEDCLNNIAQKLLKVDYEIEDPKLFIHQALFNELKIYHRTNKRYALVDIPQDIEVACIISQVNEEQEDALRLRLVRETIDNFPDGQKTAIAYFLKYGKFSAASGRMESMRTNYKLAVKKLKEMYNECK